MTNLATGNAPRHLVSRARRDRLAAAGPPPKWLLMSLLSLAQFMVVLDVTVVNVALPDIGSSLALDREALTWVVTAYTLTFGGLLVLGGRLADAFGRKYMFMMGLSLFTAGSLLVAMAGSGGILLASRVAQGMGAAMLSPAALSILTTELTGRDRNRALAVWAAIGGAGAAVGVLLGGVLTSGPGWEWAFLINVPVGLLVALGVAVVVPSRARQGTSAIDLPGALTLTAATALLIFGIIRSGDTGWISAPALLPMAASGLSALGFVIIQRASVTPLVSLSLLRRRPLPGALITMLGASALLLSAFFLNSIYLQQVRGFSAFETGLAFLPVALATIAGAQVGAQLMAHAGARAVAVAGLVVGAVGLGVLARLGTEGGVLTTLVPPLVLAAAGIGATFVAATSTAMASADHSNAGVVSGLLNTGHELGGSLGIALVSAIAGPSIAGLTADPALGFQNAYVASGLAAGAFAVAAAVLMPRGRPEVGARPRFMH